MPDGLVKWYFSSNSVNSASWMREDINYTYQLDNFKTPVTYPTTQCSLQFNIPEAMGNPVFFYYRLTSFYQNHRRYVKSFQSDQLKGTAVDNGTISSSTCDPIKLDPTTLKPYYPCGLIANSYFNDTFYSPVLLNVPGGTDQLNRTYIMQNSTGIAWDSDKDLYGQTKYTPDQVIPPPNWQARWPNNYTTDNPPPNLAEDQSFQVWMRTAGQPTFSKLAQRNDTQEMEAGVYLLQINQSRFSDIFCAQLSPANYSLQTFQSPNTVEPNQ